MYKHRVQTAGIVASLSKSCRLRTALVNTVCKSQTVTSRRVALVQSRITFAGLGEFSGPLLQVPEEDSTERPSLKQRGTAAMGKLTSDATGPSNGVMCFTTSSKDQPLQLPPYENASLPPPISKVASLLSRASSDPLLYRVLSRPQVPETAELVAM